MSLLSGVVVAQFRKAVKAENSNKLSSFDASDLFVYRNKAGFDDEKEVPLEEDSSIDGLGSSKSEALVVVPADSSRKWNWSCIKIWQHVSYISCREESCSH